MLVLSFVCLLIKVKNIQQNLIKMMINLIFLAAILIAPSHHLEILCNFERVGWDDIIGPAYTCNVMNLNTTKPKQLITTMKGMHPAGETNDNVNTFLIFAQVCELLPSGIEKYFQNMEGLAVQKSGLKKITKKDLKPFSDLISISLFGNRLEFLESNLFMFNPKLKLISVFNNQLKHIFSNILQGLNDLQRVYFSTNVCINEDGVTKDRIEQLKCKFVEACVVTDDQIEFADLEADVLTVYSENSKLKENLKAVSKNFVLTKRRLDKTEKTITILMMNNKATSNDTTNVAATVKVDLEKCYAEKFDLLELIQELEVVEIVCNEKGETTATCETDGLKVLKSQIRVVNVKRKGKLQPKRESVVELTIIEQQTLFLPLNMSHFFPNLTKLTVTHSELMVIDGEGFKGFEDLVELNLSHNKLTDLKADNFKYLMTLEKLNLSHNQIDSIESLTFNSLRRLIELKLSHNLLIRLSSRHFVTSKNLKTLTLNNNQLNEIASNLLELCCEHLDLQDFTNNECINLKFPEVSLNEIERNILENCTIQFDFECRFESMIDDYVCHGQNVVIESQNVRVVSISGDHTSFNLTIDDVTALMIVNESMMFIPLNFGTFMSNLKKLTIENTDLREVRGEAFDGLDKLTQLIIKNNKIRTISEETFSNCCDQLQLLDLSFNSIVKLDGRTFTKLSSLITVNLSKNQLITLDVDVIPSNNVIETFIVSHNKIASIDAQIIKLLKLAKVIDFEDNQCIDSKYDQAKNNDKKVMEIFGEISFKC